MIALTGTLLFARMNGLSCRDEGTDKPSTFTSVSGTFFIQFASGRFNSHPGHLLVDCAYVECGSKCHAS
jgi:hypothetical protein